MQAMIPSFSGMIYILLPSLPKAHIFLGTLPMQKYIIIMLSGIKLITYFTYGI